MNRRDFLNLIASTGVASGIAGLGGVGCTPGSGGRMGVRPRRQGIGYPVTVRLELFRDWGRADPPELMVIREGQADWSRPAAIEDVTSEAPGRAWRFSWTPPAVHPSDEEWDTELVRYRLVAIDEGGRPLGPVSEAVEVVCGSRGWGC